MLLAFIDRWCLEIVFFALYNCGQSVLLVVLGENLKKGDVLVLVISLTE